MRPTTLVCLAIFFASAPAQAAYRCTIDGRTVYQDQPCPDQVDRVVRDRQAQNKADAAAAHARSLRAQEDNGPAPLRSNWDGAYYEVQDWLEARLGDPESLEFESCTTPTATLEGWRVVCAWRNTNAFGAKVRSAGEFWIRQGRVVRGDIAQ
jgi:hypothetical protein